MKTAIFALFTLTFLGVYAQNAGIKVAVTPAAIKNFKDNVLPKFISNLEPIRVPNVKDGPLSISGITVKISLPANAVVADMGNNRLKLGTQKLGVSVSLRAKIKILLVKVSVPVTVSCNGASVIADIAFGYADQHPQISLKSLDVSILKFNAKLGKNVIAKATSSILKFVNNKLQGIISKAISASLRGVVANAINDAVKRVPSSADLPNTPLAISYNLVSAPVVTSNYLTLPVDGSFYESKIGKVTLPITPARPMPDYDAAEGSQIQLFLSEYVLNSGLYSIWHSGMLKREFDSNTIESYSNFKFNVDWLKAFIPQIIQYYALETKLVLDVFAKHAPTFTLKKDNNGLNLTVEVAISAVILGKKTELFAASCSVDLHTSLSVENWVFKPKLLGGVVRAMVVTRSSIGPIDIKLLEALNVVAATTIPKLDSSFAAFPLPSTPDVEMKMTSLATQDGFIQINANPKFKF